MMLSMGAPAHLACGQLAAADRAALAAAGVSVDGACHLCPLSIAVRQQHVEMCRLLLQYGAPASRAADGLPVLLHFLEAAGAAGAAGGRPAASTGPGSTTSGGTGGGGSHGMPSRAATPGGSMPSGQHSRGSRGSAEGLAAFLQSLEHQLQLLQLLLSSGSCPLEHPMPPHPARCFLSGVR